MAGTRPQHWLVRALVLLLSLPVHAYRWLISPLLPRACRHEPSCSAYALEALRIHGPIRGLGLTAWRLLRCAPWGTSGWDPVPPARSDRNGRPPAAVTP